MHKTVLILWAENKGIILFLILMTMFRSSLADWNVVPTGSMKPGIIEGDRILVNKVAYDLHLPFSNISLARYADPQRGDIVIFDSKASETRLVKRVIGVPGDVVAMRDNVLTVNGKDFHYILEQPADNRTLRSTQDVTEQAVEGLSYPIRIKLNSGGASSFLPVQVPDASYLVLGDNRDNSADSRYIGFVPRDEIIGRTRRVVLSLDYENYYLPRKQRFLKPL